MDHLLFAAIVFLKSNYSNIIPSYGLWMGNSIHINGLWNSDEWATDDKLGKNIAINEMKLNTVSLVYISFLISFPLKRGIQSKYAVICDSVKKVNQWLSMHTTGISFTPKCIYKGSAYQHGNYMRKIRNDNNEDVIIIK